MATIKDVAKMAGVSVTTVSIIINGKASERKISEETQQRVTDSMRALGYMPNLSARRLRSRDGFRPSIAFFWPLDYRTHILASFLNTIQVRLQEMDFDCELVIQTYENDKLNRYSTAILKNGYSGIIVGACSALDLQYLEELAPKVPLVLINRNSEQFSTIQANNNAIGLCAARQIRLRGFTDCAVVMASHGYVATTQRMQAFFSSCERLGIQVEEASTFRGPSTMKGGYDCARSYLSLPQRPKVLFFDNDTMASGALAAFHEAGVSIPGEAEVLTLAYMDPESTAYTVPSLSAIALPTASIGSEAISILYRMMSENSLIPIHVAYPFTLEFRESFPAPSVQDK